MADELLPIGQLGNKKRLKDMGDGSVAEVVSATVGSATIGGPLDRRSDATSVSVALSIEDVALLNALLGILTEAAPATDTASSGLNGRLQRIAQRLTSLIALLPTALGGTTSANSFPVVLSSDGPFASQTGSVTEAAPASDTASSGLNGRLQRIAQNITTLISSSLIAVGNVASGASDSGNPVKVGGKYNSTKPTLTNGQRGDLQVEINGALAASLYGKVTNAGDTAVLLTTAGRQIPTQGVATALIDGGSNTLAIPYDTADTARQGNTSYDYTFNATTWDRKRGVTANTVLASAARTATVSTDVTNYNGRSFAVILNITAAPNTASTITVQIRVKDSISGNYVTLLASAAILGTASQGVPVTNRYVVALGITVAANLDVSDALGRTMNVNVIHSDGASWTYSISADIGI